MDSNLRFRATGFVSHHISPSPARETGRTGPRLASQPMFPEGIAELLAGRSIIYSLTAENAAQLVVDRGPNRRLKARAQPRILLDVFLTFLRE